MPKILWLRGAHKYETLCKMTLEIRKAIVPSPRAFVGVVLGDDTHVVDLVILD